ncbi:CHAT domain-containing protein [Sphingomonas sp.]|uniref:CHAT domain-containing protein n=1 Tax=Sphingomonas sp. TaxID=28214 RepID=UPI002DD66466|nr:CHAT domain-containing protein [Sphingomonas sp.]
MRVARWMLLGCLIAATPAHAQTRTEVYDGAFRDAQMATGSRTALALSRSAARLAAGDPELAQLIRTRQDASEAAGRAESAEVAARTAQSPDPAAIARATQAAAAARAALAAADAALSARSPGYVQLTGIAPVPVAEAQALLAPDEAIVMIHSTPTHSYIFAVTRTQADWARADIGAEALAGEVRALRNALDPSGALRAGEDASGDVRTTSASGFPRARAHALYTRLWAPIERIVGKATNVYVVTGGALGGLPLAVLPTRAPRGSDADPAAMRRTEWLVRRHALVTLPSVGSLRALRAGQARGGASRPFVGFGDPALDGAPSLAAPRSFTAFAAVDGDVSARVKALPRLPGSKSELDALARILGAGPDSVVTGAEATERAVETAALGDVAVVAFATHGLLAGEIGPAAEPALVLTPPAQSVPGGDDGLLTASEAAQLKMSADWIILSACNTAASDGTASGEGLSGLARGFFSAGARAILASHWRVRDDVAQALTVGTLERWRADPAVGRATALRAAMLAMIDDRSHPERADPALWAPFVIAGEGR